MDLNSGECNASTTFAKAKFLVDFFIIFYSFIFLKYFIIMIISPLLSLEKNTFLKRKYNRC